jgi:hypothetical protein
VATALKRGDLIAAVAACNPPLVDDKTIELIRKMHFTEKTIAPQTIPETIFPQAVPEMLKEAGNVKPAMLILAGKADKKLRTLMHWMGNLPVQRYQDDSAIPLEQIKKMVALLKDGGVNVELRDIAGGHYNPLPDEDVPAVWKFLRKHSLSEQPTTAITPVTTEVQKGSPAQTMEKKEHADATASGNAAPALSLREKFQKYSELSQELPKAAAAKDSAKLLDLLQQQVAIVGKSGFDHGHANFNLACVLACLGRKDDAIKALNVAVDQGFTDADRIKNANNLKSLRGDKRFAAVIKRADPDADDETSEPVPPTAEKPAKEKAVPKKSAM